jgi:hypothetical protein
VPETTPSALDEESRRQQRQKLEEQGAADAVLTKQAEQTAEVSALEALLVSQSQEVASNGSVSTSSFDEAVDSCRDACLGCAGSSSSGEQTSAMRNSPTLRSSVTRRAWGDSRITTAKPLPSASLLGALYPTTTRCHATAMVDQESSAMMRAGSERRPRRRQHSYFRQT